MWWKAILLAPVVAVMASWAAAALYYGVAAGPRLRAAIAVAFVLAVGAGFARLRVRRALVVFGVAFVGVLAWWLTITPSNDRDWQPEVAVTPWATVDADRVTIHGVRNFDYRTETEFTPRWESRTYDLRRLDSVDLVAVYWAGRAIAHIMLSFGFAGRDYVAMSIETRKERGEAYSAVAGFFKQYETVYIVGDERDLIRVRTTYRSPQEDVYIYRLHGPIEHGRRIFLDYVKAMNEMRSRPRFYNTLTTNCTTGILLHTRVNPTSPPWSWKVLLSGYLPSYLYGLGRVDTTRPFAELERLSLVNGRAHAAEQDPAFSQRIREGLPAPARRT